MILLLALGAALLWTWLRGGRAAHVQYITFRAYGLALFAFAVQAVLVYVSLPEPFGARVHAPVLMLSYALLAVFVWQNRRLDGMWLIAAGLGANALVIAVNGGYMPITYEALVAAGKAHLVNSPVAGTLVFGSKDILLPVEETRLWMLSDIFVVPPPFPISSIFSAGDALIAAGLFRLVPFLFGVGAGTAAAPHQSESF